MIFKEKSVIKVVFEKEPGLDLVYWSYKVTGMSNQPENRIDRTLRLLKEAGKKAFVSYTTAYDPDKETSLEIMRILADNGVDILELGIPFSDPMADGVTNQLAAERALASGATLSGAMDIVKEFRKTHPEVPVVLFTYLNPVFTGGYEKFQETAIAAGVDGIILVDLTADEEVLNPELKRRSALKHIQLVSPLTPEKRKKYIGKKSEGFIYMLSRSGVTGGHSSPSEEVAENISDMRNYSDLPLIVGFGISNADMAKRIAHVADGVIVGSAIVKVVEEYGQTSELTEKLISLVKPMTEAVHSV